MNELTTEQQYELARQIKNDNYGIYVLGMLCKVLQYVTYYTGAASLLTMIGLNLPLASSAGMFLIIWVLSYIAFLGFVLPYYKKATE